MSDSVLPHRRQPTRLPCPWDSPGKNTGVGCHFLLQCVKVKLLSRVRPSATPWTAAFQAPPSMGFSRQEYWSRVPLPSPACVLTYVQFLVPHALQSNRLLCSWDSPGNKTGMDCHLHFQGIFQGSKPCHLHLLHWQMYSLPNCATWEAPNLFSEGH